jgi:hypothetical protein
MKPEEKWNDKRAPDGVTILAPYEQAHPSQYPGLLTGDATKANSLFDLQNDPGEQHDVATQNPETVNRLAKLFATMDSEVRQAVGAPQAKRQRKNRRAE